MNLIYGACFLHDKPDRLVQSLLDGLSTKRIEIDLIDFSGDDFRSVDNRVMSLKLFVYPYVEPRTKKLMTVETLDVPPALRQLYGYLIERGCIVQLSDINRDYLDIHSHEVLRKIGRDSDEWEAMVPPEVAAAIKARELFGYG